MTHITQHRNIPEVKRVVWSRQRNAFANIDNEVREYYCLNTLFAYLVSRSLRGVTLLRPQGSYLPMPVLCLGQKKELL